MIASLNSVIEGSSISMSVKTFFEEKLWWLVLALQDLKDFVSDVWEKAPKHFKADTPRRQLFPELSSLSFLRELLDPIREPSLP